MTMQGVELFGAPENPAWVPTEAHRQRSNLLRAISSWGFNDLAEMQRVSVEDPERYWRLVVDDLSIHFDKPFDQVKDDSAGRELPRWFVGGTLNAATLCSHRHAAGPLATKEAVVYEGDAGERRSLTFAQLDAEVRRFAANLSALGVARGDRVVLFMPVVPEAAIAFLGCAMIGAITVPAFTGYGPDAVATRILDSGAVAMVTADTTTRRGKEVPLKATADAAIDLLGDDSPMRHLIVVRHTGADIPLVNGRDFYFDELDPAPAPVETVSMDANEPLCIVYTSGTTGRPKGIVHSHGGFAVKAAVDFAYCFDVQENDTIGWISDLGWLIGPLLITGGLQLGATIVMIEGVPLYPSENRMFEVIERNRITLQGVAPTAMRAIAAAGIDSFGDLSSLRAFASTGEAWDEPTWWWLFSEVGERNRPIMNYTGGTEVGGGILVSYPFLSMEPASFNAPVPGADVAVLDVEGNTVVGGVGELSVLNTFPGMTHSFWQDTPRYLETYWSQIEGVWVHGDLATVDEHGVWRLLGRSDDTIKVSGRRVGPAEIEAALLRDKRIVEAAAIGVPDQQRGQRVVAFVVAAEGEVDQADLTATAAANVGRSFAPVVHIVETLPKTKNGKIMRRAIRSRHLGQPIGDMSSLDPATPLENIPVYEAGVH